MEANQAVISFEIARVELMFFDINALRVTQILLVN